MCSFYDLVFSPYLVFLLPRLFALACAPTSFRLLVSRVTQEMHKIFFIFYKDVEDERG